MKYFTAADRREAVRQRMKIGHGRGRFVSLPGDRSKAERRHRPIREWTAPPVHQVIPSVYLPPPGSIALALLYGGDRR